MTKNSDDNNKKHSLDLDLNRISSLNNLLFVLITFPIHIYFCIALFVSLRTHSDKEIIIKQMTLHTIIKM